MVSLVVSDIVAIEDQGADDNGAFHFKRVNDEHGHPAGDLALIAFATVLTGSTRRSDLAARYGGEEFVVVTSNTSPSEAALVAEKIRLAVARMRVDIGKGRERLHFSTSVGLANFPQDTTSGHDLIRLADEALYAAKGQGRNRVVDIASMVRTPARARSENKKEPSPMGEGSLN